MYYMYNIHATEGSISEFESCPELKWNYQYFSYHATALNNTLYKQYMCLISVEYFLCLLFL